MNSQSIRNCPQSRSHNPLNMLLETLVGFCRRYRDHYRAARDRKESWRQLRRLDQAALRDIGLHDPQKQLQILGRYL